MIAGRRKEYLRLVLQPAEGFRMDNAIAIALKRRSDIVFRFVAQPSTCIGALCRLWRQNLTLTRLEVFADARHSVTDLKSKI
jgi:hypothetical protein